MKVLVTGGTGVIGESTVRALHGRGHAVRVLARHADHREPWWPSGIEGWAGDVSDDATLRGAADGCDAVIHIAGIADEDPPARTFQSVNIEGTRNVVLEAERAGVRRVVFVSSLGAERGQSGYHKSKCVAEDVVRGFSREWVVLRPGAVYGPGDENISVLLRMIRTLPVIPTIGDGEQQFQPIWHEDVAEALALATEREDVRGKVLEVAGVERTSQNDLTSRLRAITERPAVQAPLPQVIASWAMRALDAAGVDVPFSEAQMTMLTEGNVILAGRKNALTDVLGITPTSLDEGLRRLASEQPAQHPSEGVGTFKRKRYWIDIANSPRSADQLFDYFREHLPELMSSLVQMKRESPTERSISEGSTLTLDLPVRGQVQVRVAEARERRMTLLTLAGHPIAGAVRFLIDPIPTGIRFEIQVYDRPASMLDQVMLRSAGDWVQRLVWVDLATQLASVAGGASGEVQMTEEDLDERELMVVDSWARSLSAQFSRNSTSSGRD